MYLSDLRVYFKVEGYFRVTWSRIGESPQLVRHCAWAIRPETLTKFIIIIIIIIIKIAETISGISPHYQRWIYCWPEGFIPRLINLQLFANTLKVDQVQVIAWWVCRLVLL